MADEYPADFSDPVGRVRKYIPDLTQVPDPKAPDGPKSYIFTDDEIQSFLDDETLDGTLPVTSYAIKRAAAWAMIAIANTENLILKKIVTQDQQTDGPSVAKALIAAASTLFARADAEQAMAMTPTATEGLLAFFPEQTHAPDYNYPSWAEGGVIIRPLL